jgi:hypothetical protein
MEVRAGGKPSVQHSPPSNGKTGLRSLFYLVYLPQYLIRAALRPEEEGSILLSASFFD